MKAGMVLIQLGQLQTNESMSQPSQKVHTRIQWLNNETILLSSATSKKEICGEHHNFLIENQYRPI